MRSGLNYSLQGGNTYCASKNKVGRLGNECDTYAEISLDQEIYNKQNNVFAIHTTMAFDTKAGDADVDHQGNAWQDNGLYIKNQENGVFKDKDGKYYTGNVVTDARYSTGSWGGIRTAMEQMYGDYKMPSGATLWAGKRFYQRKDIHILDYYYLNGSGIGVGVENIPLNNLGSLNFAILKSQTDVDDAKGTGLDGQINSYKLDARWNGIPMWTDASLDVALIYSWDNLSDNQKKNLKVDNNPSFLGMIEYTQGNFFGGFNKLSFTYGNNGFGNVQASDIGNGASPAPTYGKGFRLIDWGVIEQAKWNLGYAFIVGHISTDDYNGVYQGGSGWTGKTHNYYQFTLRPSFKWSQYTSTVVEYGYFRQTRTSWDDNRHNYASDRQDSLSKLTIAQEWTPGDKGFWSRPSLRVFATWLTGNELDHKWNNDDSHEIVFGAQVEAWW